MVSIASRRVSSWPVAIGKVRQSTMMSPTSHAPVAGEVLDQPGGHRDLPLRGAGLALLVDGQRDHRRAVLADQRHHPGDPRVRAVAVLVVHRVDHRAAAEQLQAGLDHRGLGGVEHERQGGRGGQPAGDLAHVRDAVPADVVDAHVEQVRAVPGLRPGDLHAVVVPAGQHRVAERLGAVGVGPLPDREERGVLPERHVLVQRGDARLGLRAALGPRPAAAEAPGQRGDVLGGGAAAAADQGQAELVGEQLVRVGQLVRGRPGSRRRPRSARAGRRSACRTAGSARARPGSAGARSSRRARSRSSARSGRCRAAPARSAPRRSRCRAASCRWSRSSPEAISTASVPASPMARRAPMIAALACSRSWQVSTISASAPPRSRPAAFCW